MKLNALDIAKMSREERLAAIEALWESLVKEQAEIESPDWHRDVLEERERRIAEGRAVFIDLDELKKRLRKASR
jgi:putative addiction module component (TIGR02574 family)